VIAISTHIYISYVYVYIYTYINIAAPKEKEQQNPTSIVVNFNDVFTFLLGGVTISIPIGSMYGIYANIYHQYNINIPQMLAYIPYMDPMGYKSTMVFHQMAMAQSSTRGSGFVDAMTFDPEYAARHKHQRQQPIRGALSRGHGRGTGPVVWECIQYQFGLGYYYIH
jgi:hypothetical protein